MEKTKSEYIIVKKSTIHGKGVYARKRISKGTRIIEYVGKKLTNKEIDADEKYDAKEVYLFELNKRYSLDGDVSYNTAQYINHSCDPNCETDVIQGYVWIIALRDIKKGEELTYNYGFDKEDYKEYFLSLRR